MEPNKLEGAAGAERTSGACRNAETTVPRYHDASVFSLPGPLPAKLNAGTAATEGRTSLVGMKVVLPPSRQKRPRGRTKRPPGGGASVTEREPRKCKVARTTDEHRDQPADADDEPLLLPVGAVSIMLHSLCDSPHDILNLSLVSKDIRASCTESMESVCRRRWQDKFEFQHRWDSAVHDKEYAKAGPTFWYYRFFEEERKAITTCISGDDLKRLSWRLQKQPQHRRDYLINFNSETPRFKKNREHAVDAIDQGRTEGGLTFLYWGPAKNRSHWTSVNWFLEEDGRNGTVLCLGLPNKSCIPCMKFKVNRSPDNWLYGLCSDMYTFTSVAKMKHT